MLDAWKAIVDPADRVIACFGDSTGEGTVGITNGGYPEILRNLMSGRWGMGGMGLYGTWRNEWSFTAGGNAWTASSNSDNWAVGPYQGLFANTHVMRGSSATQITTWTVPLTQPSVSGFDLWLVDGPSSSDFSYSIDGGTWTNVNHSWSQANNLVKLSVIAPVTTSVRIRGANSAGTAATVYVVGLEPVSSGASGVIVHNMCANGEFSFSSIRTNNPAWGGWIDAVQPSIVTVMYTNDLGLWDSNSYQASLQTLIDRVNSYGGEVILMTFCGQDGRNEANYTEQRTVHDTLAAANSLYHINFYDLMGDYAQASAAGYMSDSLHPSNAGAEKIAGHIWAYLAKTGIGARHRIAQP